LEPLLDLFGRWLDADASQHARGEAAAEVGLLDPDAVGLRILMSFRKFRLDRLQIYVVDRRRLARHAVVVHRVHAVGGDVHLEGGVRAGALDRLDSDAGVRQILRKLAVVDIELNEVAHPIWRDPHANCSRKRTSPWKNSWMSSIPYFS